MLARDLGVTVAELDARMAYGEYLRWRAFYNWERWMAEMEAAKARVRAKDQASKRRR